MSEVRGFTIRNEGGVRWGSHVLIDGFDMTPWVRALHWRHQGGDLPVLDLELLSVPVTEITGRATLRVLIGGQEFTWEDVDNARSAGLLLLADRLARVLPPREKP